MLYNTLLVLSALAATASGKKSYSDHSVLRCDNTDRKQLDFLHDLEEDTTLGLDIWQEARQVGAPVDIMVPKRSLPMLAKMLSQKGIKCSSMIPNVQEAIDATTKKSSNLRGDEVGYFEEYHDWKSVHAYVDSLAEEFPNLATTSTIGSTYFDRPQKIITLSTSPGSGKPALWFDGGLHAREWVTVTTVTYLADTLLRNYNTTDDNDATYLLDTYDVIICPILNVDGYDNTWTDDRMWRKTMSPNTGSPCDGTDPNRNWEFHWGEAGTSTQKCSDSYEGASAASEIEVQNIQSYLYDHKDTLKGFINFHSYSQLWMSNWGYTDELPPDYETQNGLSKVATEAIKNTHGMTYEYGPIASTIYPASGSSADYTYGVCGIVYSYGVELRDTGKYGFLLPPDQIIPTGEEIYASVIAMGKYIDENALKK